MTGEPNGPRQEDDVVEDVAAYLRADCWTIIVTGAVQGKFWITLTDGSRKAPDVVAFRDGTLLVGEAKSRASALFNASGGTSDAEVILAVLTDLDVQSEAVRKADAVLRSRGLTATITKVVGALIAGTPLGERTSMVQHADLVYIDALEGGVQIVSGSFS